MLTRPEQVVQQCALKGSRHSKAKELLKAFRMARINTKAYILWVVSIYWCLLQSFWVLDAHCPYKTLSNADIGFRLPSIGVISYSCLWRGCLPHTSWSVVPRKPGRWYLIQYLFHSSCEIYLFWCYWASSFSPGENCLISFLLFFILFLYHTVFMFLLLCFCIL